jgi:hypothetical protein
MKFCNIIILFLSIILIFSCDDFNVPKGDLKITIKDNTNNPVIGTDVYIYDNKDDMIKEANFHYAWKITDSVGLVYFKDIEVQTYWFYANITNQGNELLKLSDSAVVVIDSTINVVLMT